MKLLVTGAAGQLGEALRDVLENGHEVVWTDVEELDVRDLEGTRAHLAEQRPYAVLHLAAMTQVDACEAQAERAFEVNALGTRYLALAAREIGAEMLFISTDYVFGGAARDPYHEYDPPDPINVYGRSKLHGERAVSSLVPQHYIVRTSGLFGPGGQNFVEAVLRKARAGESLRIVADQICRPTFAPDLAAAVGMIIGSGNYGIFHVASAGETSWAGFAREILKAARITGIGLEEISSAELDRAAPRPAYSVLDTRAFELTFGHVLPPWTAGLSRYLSAGVG